MKASMKQRKRQQAYLCVCEIQTQVNLCQLAKVTKRAELSGFNTFVLCGVVCMV